MRPKDRPIPPAPSRYDWLAFCYLHGELDAEEQRRWEQLLVEDEQARVALVKAMELTEAAQQVFHQTAIPAPRAVPRRSRRLNLHVISLASGVAVAVALALVCLSRLSIVPQPIATDFSPATPALAEAWFKAYQAHTWDRNVGQPQAIEGPADTVGTPKPVAGDGAVELELDSLPDAAVAAPSWLMLAVAEYHGSSLHGGAVGTEGQP